ncbi:MAG: hydantoinase B/oxoprolinase family protein, partial [Acidimicrobiales bacterium]
YAIRAGSGGVGLWEGGNGVVREFEALAPMDASLVTERRRHAPHGAAGGGDGVPGCNRVNGNPAGAKAQVRLAPGDVLRIETPGGGGWGTGNGERGTGVTHSGDQR